MFSVAMESTSSLSPPSRVHVRVVGPLQIAFVSYAQDIVMPIFLQSERFLASCDLTMHA